MIRYGIMQFQGKVVLSQFDLLLTISTLLSSTLLCISFDVEGQIVIPFKPSQQNALNYAITGGQSLTLFGKLGTSRQF